jgi:hypothetical protein
MDASKRKLLVGRNVYRYPMANLITASGRTAAGVDRPVRTSAQERQQLAHPAESVTGSAFWLVDITAVLC